MNNKQPADYKMLGERLCLDFTNTVDWRESAEPGELLTSYQQLLKWSIQTGLFSEDDGHIIMERAVLFPTEAKQVY